ncbi:MAG: DUF669 domain-containing protein [Candidatus Eisenbacteria sp.]|nr:DUF669 domain-containing protein [Candidatus Eisenbacteria bacterium]
MTENDAVDVVEEFELTKFDDDFAAAEVEIRDAIPDGRYQVRVEHVELTRSRAAGNPMLKWTLRILDGPQEGRCLWRHNMLITAENIKWLKTDLHRCGVEIAKLSDLPENLGRLRDLVLEVTKRTRDENSNVFINKRVEQADGSETVATDAGPGF